MKKALILLTAMLAFATTGMAQRSDLSGLKICIDPGHGGHNDNDRPPVYSDIPFWESDGNFAKALLLRDMLQSLGATVILTRTSNDSTYANNDGDPDEPGLQARVAIANANNVDWFHSIHSNALSGSNTTTDYTLLLVREKRSLTDRYASTGVGMGIPERPESLPMSSLILDSIVRMLRTTKNSVYLDWTFYGGASGGFSLGVLRGLAMPGELSEGSFHDYYPEVCRLMNNDYRKMEAYGIRNAMMQYFGVPADTHAMVAGIQRDVISGAPVNFTSVRILPEGTVKTGDAYKNGFYMFDGLTPGPHVIRFETPGYSPDSVSVDLGASSVTFVDRNLIATGLASVVTSSPVDGDSAYAMNLPITLQFNKPMDTASVRTAWSITPQIDLAFSWTNSNSRLTCTPAGYFPFGVTYLLRVDSTARAIDGKALDGAGTGIAASPFVVHFKTKYVDLIPPRIIARYPDSLATVYGGNQFVSLTFDKVLDPSSIVIANVAMQQVGGGAVSRTLQSWTSSGKTGLAVFPATSLASPASYRVRVSGFKDMLGNTMSTASPLLWTFATTGLPSSGAGLDDFSAGAGKWKQPSNSSSTVGVDSASFMTSTSLPLNIPGGIPGAGILKISWTPNAGNSLVHLAYDSSSGALVPLAHDWTILQSYVYGDGRGTGFRFTVKSDQGGLASRWYSTDWVGWRLVQWYIARDSSIAWGGPAWISGLARFAAVEVRPSLTDTIRQTFIAMANIQVVSLTVESVDDRTSGIPAAFRLRDAFPNPFNPSTTLRYELPTHARVTLAVYDVLGRTVALLADGEQTAGVKEVRFDAAGYASGMYFARLTVSGSPGQQEFTRTIKLLLMK